MKNNLIKSIVYTLFILMLSVSFNACTVHNHKTVVVKKKRIPPGHAKKIHGDKSAKKHAHGHH